MSPDPRDDPRYRQPFPSLSWVLEAYTQQQTEYIERLLYGEKGPPPPYVRAALRERERRRARRRAIRHPVRTARRRLSEYVHRNCGDE